LNATQTYFSKSDWALDGIDLLQGAPKEILSDLTDKCEWLEFSENEVVVDIKDASTSVYFVAKGKLRALDYMKEEQEVSLAEVQSGDVFGELSAIDLEVRSARVIALEPTLLAKLPSEDFQRVLKECPDVAVTLLHRFAGIIRRMTNRITSMSTLSPHQRIYNELLRLSEPDTGNPNNWIISNAPNHEDLSTWVGTDKQTVADAIGGLARDGVIERKHRNLVIKDHVRLQRLIGQ
jgi:CRP/FNR family cyclic AMP-dependent transcriptional regulator